MARNSVRKTNKGLFSREKIHSAILKVRAGMKVRTAAKETGINYQTLFRYVKKTSNIDDITTDIRLTPNYAVRRIFSDEQENTLVKYVLDRSALGYGMTALEIRKLALDLAKENKIKVLKNWEASGMAGKDWFESFMRRHPQLSSRKPEQCSIARAMAFNKPNIASYFLKLESVLQRHPNFASGLRVYNLDETSTTTVGSITERIISPRGAKQVHQVKSQERGVNVTTCCIIGATGVIVPPAMIFPRAKFTNDMLFNAYPGTLGLATKKGWMTGDMFVPVLEHFIRCTGSSKDNPTLLILDNVESHLSVKALEVCKSNGVTLFTLPPHTTHKTQPLDVGIFGPFQAAYNSAHHNWTVSHPGQVCSIRDIASLVNSAMCKSFTPGNILSAFKSTGISPFNSNVFDDSEFLPSKVTEKLNPDSTPGPAELQENEVTEDPLVDTNANVLEISGLQARIIPEEDNQHEGKKDMIIDNRDHEMEPVICTPKKRPFVTPAMLKGYPKAAEKGNKKSTRRKGKCMIATDTPEKKLIEERAAETHRKKVEVEERKKRRSEKNTVQVRAERNKKNSKNKIKSGTQHGKGSQRLHFDEDSEDEDNPLPLHSEMPSSQADSNLLVNPKTFKPLARSPTEGEHVLVAFQSGKEAKYYIGKVLKEVDDEGDIEVSYYRASQKLKGTFVLPHIPDLKSVPLSQVKMLLPQPSFSSGTARQKNFLSFKVDFSQIKVG